MDTGDVPARIAKAPTHIIGFDEITGRVCHLLNWHSESQQFLQAPYVIS
jgi:hypothetical protein